MLAARMPSRLAVRPLSLLYIKMPHLGLEGIGLGRRHPMRHPALSQSHTLFVVIEPIRNFGVFLDPGGTDPAT